MPVRHPHPIARPLATAGAAALLWTACQRAPAPAPAPAPADQAASASSSSSASPSANPSGDASAAAPRTTESLPATPATAAARARLLQAFTRLETAYPYRFVDTSSVKLRIGFTVPPMTRVTEYAAADRSRVTWTRGSDRGEIVNVGGRTFLKTAGQWHETGHQATQTTGQSTARGAAAPPDAAQRVVSGLEDVQAIGAETLDGVSTSAYRFTFAWKMLGLSFGGTGTAWIRAADGLPHRTDLELHAAGIEMTSRLAYEYGVAVDIAPPVL